MTNPEHHHNHAGEDICGYGDIFNPPTLSPEEEARFRIAKRAVDSSADAYTQTSQLMDAARKVGIEITNLDALGVVGGSTGIQKLDHSPGITDRIRDIGNKLDMPEKTTRPEGENND